MNILVAPANYYIDGGMRGSEPLWSHEILRSSAPHVGRITAIAGYTMAADLPSNVSVHTLYKSAEPLRIDTAGVVLDFMRRYSIVALQELRRSRFSLIHHMLPFAVHRTFNVLPFTCSLPLVIGPVQGLITPKPYGELMAGARTSGDNRSAGSGDSVNRFVALTNPLLQRANLALLRRAAAVVAVSDVAAESLMGLVDEERIRIIPPGVDCDVFVQRPLRADEAYTLLVSGYLVRRKRIDIVLSAAARLRQHFNIRLLIAGDGPQQDELRAIAKNSGVSDIVTWLGFVPNNKMPEVYRMADVLVSASEHEGLPTAYLEAMACGLPVAAACNQGALALKHANAPITLARIGDASSLADAIGELLDRERLESRTGVIAQFAAARYDWKQIGRLYANLYAQVLSRS